MFIYEFKTFFSDLVSSTYQKLQAQLKVVHSKCIALCVLEVNANGHTSIVRSNKEASVSQQKAHFCFPHLSMRHFLLLLLRPPARPSLASS